MKENKTKALVSLFGIYTACLVIMNILAVKQIDIWIFTVTTGILVSPIVFIIQDVTAEVFGFNIAKKMILLGFGTVFLGTAFYQIAIIISPSIFWENQEAFKILFSTTTRISIASFSAYISGSLINAKVMTALRKKFKNKLFFRAISSTIAGQFIDNAVFSFVGFLGILPIGAIISMIIGATLFEVIYEIILFPITKTSIKKIEKYINI